MDIVVRCFAQLRELAASRAELELADGATVADAWTALEGRFPALAPHRPYVRPARNGVYAAWDLELAGDDVIAFLPPVSGGAVTAIVDGPIDLAALERAVASSGISARARLYSWIARSHWFAQAYWCARFIAVS